MGKHSGAPVVGCFVVLCRLTEAAQSSTGRQQSWPSLDNRTLH